jgi:hypothetical protein
MLPKSVTKLYIFISIKNNKKLSFVTLVSVYKIIEGPVKSIVTIRSHTLFIC